MARHEEEAELESTTTFKYRGEGIRCWEELGWTEIPGEIHEAVT